MNRGRRCGTLCGQAGEGFLRKVYKDCLMVSSAHVRFGIINRKRKHSWIAQYRIFSSSIWPLQHRVEELGLMGRQARKVKGICNLGIIRWTMDSKLSRGWAGLCPRPTGKTCWGLLRTVCPIQVQ